MILYFRDVPVYGFKKHKNYIVMRRIRFLAVGLFFGMMVIAGWPLPASGQIPDGDEGAHSEPAGFTPASASDYILYLIGLEKLWKDDEEPLKHSLMRLVDHYREPFDSVRSRLERFPFEKTELMPTVIVRHDTLPVRWLNRSIFIVDTVALEKDPYIIQKTLILRTLDPSQERPVYPPNGSMTDIRLLIDSVLQVRDTITEYFVDTEYLESKNIQMHRVSPDRIDPPLVPPRGRKTFKFLEDSVRIVVSEATPAIVAGQDSPFYIVPDDNMPDSLRLAVETLLSHAWQRDSILLYLQGLDGRKTPFWLTTGTDDLSRYWIKNADNDSVTVWLGNPTKYDLKLVLEENLGIERMEQKTVDDIPITTAQPARVLAAATPIREIPVYWKLGFVSSFTLNQNYLSNWARGGESSLSSMLDVNATARYTKAESNEQWTNSGRLRYGTVRSKERGFRTSTDILELNSQYNKKIWKKFDFSSVLYAKTQVAKGYKPPNDSVPVSQFMSPGSFTIGAGIEFKPSQKTAINFSMLSYRNTFVLDTAAINQRAYGIDSNKRARQEMGGQLMIRNTTSIMEGLTMTNAIRLFSNYLDKPQNVDVDWELGFVQQINWYFTVRVNLHLIYDDDIRFPVIDKDGNPELLPDGTPKRVPKTQFNQFLGLTLSFRI